MNRLLRLWQSFNSVNDRPIYREPENGHTWRPWSSHIGTTMLYRKVNEGKEGNWKLS